MSRASTRISILEAGKLLIPHDRIAAAQMTDLLGQYDKIGAAWDAAERHFLKIGLTAAKTDVKMHDLTENLRNAMLKLADIGSKVATTVDVYITIESMGLWYAVKQGVRSVGITLATDLAKQGLLKYLEWDRWTFAPPQEGASDHHEIVIGNAHGGRILLKSGNDTFIGDSKYAYDIKGGDGNDRIIGGTSGRDAIMGEGGNDIIIARSGVLAAGGGKGNDWVEIGGKNGAAQGDTGNDTLIGGAYADFLHGVDAPVNMKTILASSPLDRKFIVGAGSDDTIYGGMGNDIIAGDGVMDSADGSKYLAPLYAAVNGKIPLTNGAGGNDSIVGYAGNDIISGGAGKDIIYGDDAAPNARTTVVTGIGNDSLFGDAGNDTIHGGWGNDSIYGGANDDFLYDSFNFQGVVLPTGKTDNDRIYGGTGNDRIFLTEGADTVDGGAGTDTLQYLHKHGMAFVYSDDPAASTPLVKAYDSYNLAKGTITDAKVFDTIKNVEVIKGTAYNDLYLIGESGMRIEDAKGNDKYVLLMNSLWDGSKSTKTDIVNSDGHFVVKLAGDARHEGIMFTSWKYATTGSHPVNYYDVWIENSSGTLTQSVRSAAWLDDNAQRYLYASRTGGALLSTLGAPIPDELITRLRFDSTGIHIKAEPGYGGGGPDGPSPGSPPYTGPIHEINFNIPHMPNISFFDAVTTQLINFDVATQTWEFNFG